MSTGAYGADGHAPEYPSHLGAWPMHYLGWDQLVRPTRDTTITLRPIEQSPDVLDFWLEGKESPEHFLVERRARIGCDRNLPGEGLIVYHVNELAMSTGLAINAVNSGTVKGLMVVEGDADNDLLLGRNWGDANDPMPGSGGVTRFDDFTTPRARSTFGSYTNIALEDITPVGTSTRMQVRVHASGWLDPEDHTGPSHLPVLVRSAARASGHDGAGTEYFVTSVYVAGHPQVSFRSSAAWDQPQQMSQSTGAALDPALAVLPDGDLALVWSDSRRGRSDIYYRARIRGSWTPETAIVRLPGDCRAPSIACDARGGLYLAFRYQNADTLRILYEQFNYMNPAAQPVVAAAYPFQPDNPIVTMAADGHGYVLWQDRRPSGEIWLAPVRHDTGFQPKRSLSSWTAPQTSYTATLDSAGALHVAWNASSPWVNEVRYMKLEFADDPDPEQLTLVAPTGPVESVALDVDGEGSLHAAYSVSGGDGVSLRYLRRWPDGYWDAGTTDLSYPGSYIGQMPVLIARRGGNMDLIYTGELAGQTRYMLRRRVLTPEASPTLDAPAPLVTTYEPVLGPNPARAGQRIRVAGARQGDAPDALEVFDTAGRRLARVPVTSSGDRWHAEISAASTAGWNAGVYFARATRSARGPTRFVIVR
jgi:hypothetical protein